jgi:hypothetical protein
MKLNKMMNLHFAQPTNIINPPALFKYSKNSVIRPFNHYYQEKSNNNINNIPLLNNHYIQNSQKGNKNRNLDIKEINNNNKCSFSFRKENNSSPKELILNIKSSNKKYLINSNSKNENEIQDFNNIKIIGRTDQKYNVVKNKIRISQNKDFNSLLKNATLNDITNTSTLKSRNKYSNIDIDDDNSLFGNRPATITISLKDNDILKINYIPNSSKEKKRCIIRPLKKNSNISSRKMTTEFINNIPNRIQTKKNSDTICSLKYANFDKNVNNKIIKQDQYFCNYIFEHINRIRMNPKYFIKHIQKSKNNISTDIKGNPIYKSKLKVALTKGKEAFDEAINSLKEIKPMNPLLFKKELCIEISPNEKEFRGGDYLKKKIIEKMNKGIKIKAFWRDIINDPEINFLLMIVDDNPIKPGAKRTDILNPKMKYIGINSAYLGSYFVCYIVLSDK